MKAIEFKRSMYIPATERPTPKQIAFAVAPFKEVGFGGSAGSGKTSAILYAALQYVEEPEYKALIIRRTFSDLNLPGSILQRAHMWLDKTNATWEGDHNRFRFPSGALLQFGYLQNDKDMYRYDSAEFQFIAVDEAVQFHEHQYEFLFGRLRRAKNSQIPIRMRNGTNPGNIGHRWYKNRFILAHNDRERLFIPAKFHENPGLDYEEYKKTLMKLSPLLQKQRMEGDWDAEQEGAIFKNEWVKYTDILPDDRSVKRVRYWDLAASIKTTADYTASAEVALGGDGTLYIRDMIRGRWEWPDAKKIIIQTMLNGNGTRHGIEEAMHGLAAVQEFRREDSLANTVIQGIKVDKDKISRALPWAARAESGSVKLVRGIWNAAFLDEVCAFPLGAHDDQVDTISGGVQMIAKNREWRIY